MVRISFLLAMKMSENEISQKVIQASIKVHQHLGPGLFEHVYQTCLSYELTKSGLMVQTEVSLPIQYEELLVEDAFKVDILINNMVILELKAVTDLLPIHSTQLTTYLKLSDKKLGLSINFGGYRLMDGFRRIVNNLPE